MGGGGDGGQVGGLGWDEVRGCKVRTCQAKGRLLRFRRAKRMARNFQMPQRLDRPSISRIDFRLRVGAMMNWGEGIGEGVCLIEALSSLYTNKRTIPRCHVSEIS